MERVYERLERLERGQVEIQAAISELRRRVDGVERLAEDLHEMKTALTRLEGRLEAVLAKMNTWQAMVWALLALIMGGIFAAGFRAFEQGGP